MSIQILDYNFSGDLSDYLEPFSTENLPTTVITVIAFIAIASLLQHPPSSDRNRIIEKIEPQTVVSSESPQAKAEIRALQEENEALKCELAEFEGGAIHPLLDAPMKCGRIALLEERAVLQARIATGRQNKLERTKPKISASKAGETLDLSTSSHLL